MILGMMTLVTCLLAADPVMDLDSVRKVVDALQADLQDVEYLYEGGVKHVAKNGVTGIADKTFQGTCAYRADGSLAIDMYTRQEDPSPSLTRQVFCITDRYKVAQLDFQPDRPLERAQLIRKQGGITLQNVGSPLRFVAMPVLLYMLRDTDGYLANNKLNYECSGWEDVDGHRCLKIGFFSEFQFKGAPKVRYTYWLDMARSANVIKAEFRYQNKVWDRLSEVVLASFPVGATKEFWYPVRGVYRSYITGNRAKDGEFETLADPVYEEQYVIVNAAPRWNQKLPNERFEVDYVKTAATALQAARSEVDASLRRPPRSLKVQVDRSIAQANQQRTLLEASAPSRDWFPGTIVGVSLLGAAGVASLGVAWIMRQRA